MDQVLCCGAGWRVVLGTRIYCRALLYVAACAVYMHSVHGLSLHGLSEDHRSLLCGHWVRLRTRNVIVCVRAGFGRLWVSVVGVVAGGAVDGPVVGRGMLRKHCSPTGGVDPLPSTFSHPS